MNERLSRFYNKKHNYGLYTFVIALLIAAVLFVPFIIKNGGIFYYYGDFNVQEIPFYQLAHDTVRNGGFGWSYLTDLGSDFLSSYSFYLLGSPFFWLTIPFPSEFVPYLIGPLLILKFGCAALSAYLYLKRYIKNKTFAVIGGLLYAFSGFSIYNVFFFHFHEPLIMFPLLLAALDAFIYDKKRIVFALAVFSACVVNYYFFVGQVIFVVMYYLMLNLTKTCKFNIKEFLILAVEVIIGFAATAFILLPSVLGLMGNPRLESLPNGWGALVYELPQKYWLIIISFFFPADTPAFPVFTPDSNCKWASVAGWLPLFGMTGVIAYMQLRSKSWLKKLIMLLMLFAFVPVLNSLFQMLNSSIYYARWFYMIVLMFVLATVRALENSQTDWNRAIRWSAGITVGLVAFIGLMPNTIENDDETESLILGVQSSFERFWLYALLSMISLLAFVLIYKKFKNHSRRFSAMLLLGTVLVSLVTSFFVVTEGVVSSNTCETINNDIINKRDGIDIDDIDEVRSDFYECVDNTQMFWQIQSINCFQSSVSSSIMKFYDAMGITRDVASRPDTNAYGLRAFFSCKYLFDYKDDDDSFIDDDGNTKMPDWTYLKNNNGFDIYENDCYIPMGFTYDSFVTEEEFERIDKIHKTEAVLYAMVLSKEQMEKYSDITGYSESAYKLLYGEHPEYFDSVVDTYKFGDEQYEDACEELKASSCSSFEYTDNGFAATYNNTGSENLLFFSVPYSSGFSATVNGEPVEIEEVTYGFMAVKIPAKTECNVVFTYETPGFSLGCKISLAAFCALLVYSCTILIFRRHRSAATLKRKENE
jgi:uncharacterized membrane protein YfhO